MLKKSLTINTPPPIMVVMSDEEKIKQRLELLLNSGWLPGAEFCNLIKERVGDVIPLDGIKLDPHADLPGKSPINTTLSAWVLGLLDDRATLDKLTALAAHYHHDHVGRIDDESDGPMSPEQESAGKPMQAWKAIMAETTDELRKLYTSAMRLKLISESGYPMGERFLRLLRIARVPSHLLANVEQSADPFSDRREKEEIDTTLVKWASGQINDDIALNQLLGKAVDYHYGNSAEGLISSLTADQLSNLPFARTVVNAFTTILFQASPEVYNTYMDETSSVELADATGISGFDVKNHFAQERRNKKGGNDSSHGR